jgi:hypothetical protein
MVRPSWFLCNVDGIVNKKTPVCDNPVSCKYGPAAFFLALGQCIVYENEPHNFLTAIKHLLEQWT